VADDNTSNTPMPAAPSRQATLVNFAPGDLVRVTADRGTFRGQCGRVAGVRVVVEFDIFGRTVSVDLYPEDLERVNG
jgi:transcription antitermination factor NusG